MNQFKKIKLRNTGEPITSQRQEQQQPVHLPSLLDSVRQGVMDNNINQPSQYKLR